MTSWNPGDQQSGQPGYGQQPGQQPPPPNFDKGATPPAAPPPAAPPPAYGAPPPQPGYGQQPPAYGAAAGGGYAAPPTNQYGNSPYGAPQGGGNLPPGAVGPLSMGNRVIAFIIDGVILNIISLIAFIILFTGVIGSAGTVSCNYTYDSNGVPTDYNCDNVGGASAGIIITVLVMFAIVIAAFVYYIFVLGKTGQTPGKKIMGVKVVDNDSGQPIGVGRAFLRYLVQYLSNIVCYAGLWSAWLDGPPEGRYRGWHDKAVNSVVISVK